MRPAKNGRFVIPSIQIDHEMYPLTHVVKSLMPPHHLGFILAVIVWLSNFYLLMESVSFSTKVVILWLSIRRYISNTTLYNKFDISVVFSGNPVFTVNMLTVTLWPLYCTKWHQKQISIAIINNISPISWVLYYMAIHDILALWVMF